MQTYLPPDDKQKLNRLARACNTSESELANKMISYSLNHFDYVNWIQSQHGVKDDDPFRIIPVKENGRLVY
ncbi:CopG family transcriptional regulator [Ammoniphilus sp. 3BR4]